MDDATINLKINELAREEHQLFERQSQGHGERCRSGATAAPPGRAGSVLGSASAATGPARVRAEPR
jgi:hypothetical protein